jgi:hypothetical protein
VAPFPLPRSAGASISADDLYVRYKIACDLKQPVDRVRIAGAIHRWCGNFGIASVAIQFVTTAEQIKRAARAAGASRIPWDARVAAWDVWAARDAKAAWAVRHAWDASAARDAWATRNARARRDAAWAARAARAARDVGDAWVGRAAWNAWAATDLSYVSTAAIRAASEGEEAALQKWLPLLEAFEAGAFCLWIGAETIYVAIIPSVVAVDDRRRLHCADGPAFAWLDDIREFYWHSVNVPDFVIERPREIAVEHIDAERNSEVRRLMIERYRLGDEIHGAGAFMRDAGGKRLDHDERFGTLWRRDVKNDEPIVILEVVNSTREPDGSFKHYWLRVPPNMKTAHEASAWTFDIEPAKYAPLIET